MKEDKKVLANYWSAHVTQLSILCSVLLHKECFFYIIMHLQNQDEDSEDEPKLKYERLANGVTEILQKDAASCMTVHDKVEVISLRPTHQQHIPHCLCRHLRGPFFKLVFFKIPCALSQCPQSILFSPCTAFPLREAHQRRFCLFSVYSLSYMFFFAPFFCQRLIFLREGHSRSDV